MNRRRADVVAAVFVSAVVLFGLLLSWNAYQRQRAFEEAMGSMGSMMGGSGMMGSSGVYSGTDPLVYLFGTLVVGAVLIVGYGYLRSDIVERTAGAAGTGRPSSDGGIGVATAGSTPGPGPDRSVGSDGADSTGPEQDAFPHDGTNETDEGGMAAEGAAEEMTDTDQPESEVAKRGSQSVESELQTSIATKRLLDVLPEDERRILEPVLDSPGLTQIALRDRSDFSKSKVSQTVSDLEKRGLLYRERQGRTYRVYPSDDLGSDSEE
ncbi:MAG: helix-turn-helix transcriptional regulator [Halodesulfurarchaeum sp.]